MSLGSCPEQLKDASQDVEKIKEYLYEFSKNLDITGKDFCPGETDGSQILRVVLILLLTINCAYLVESLFMDLINSNFSFASILSYAVISVFIWFYSSTINLLEKSSKCELENEEEAEELVTRIEAAAWIQASIPILIAAILALALVIVPIFYSLNKKPKNTGSFGFGNDEQIKLNRRGIFSGSLTTLLGFPIFIILVNALNHRDKWIDIYKSPVFIKS